MITSLDPMQVGEGMLSEQEEIYKENILDHYRNPRNAGKLMHPTLRHREYNPTCGDDIELFLEITNGEVSDVKFSGRGCAISQASTSMLTDAIKNKTVEEVRALTREDVLEMLGIPIGVVRMKCALLSLKALAKSIEQWRGKNEA